MSWFLFALGIVAGLCLALGARAAALYKRGAPYDYEVLDDPERPLEIRVGNLPHLSELEHDPLVIVNLRTGRRSELLS